MTRTVAVYARVSTEHEAQLSALDNQIEYYDDILKKNPDWVLYKRYIDEGITGTSINKRKEFLRMLEDAQKGKFDLIITREVSRFARNTLDTLQQTRELKKIGVEVYFTEDNIWTFKDEDGELKLTIMATLAQNESKKISQRVKAGQKISFQKGVIYGTGNILGYDKVGKEFVQNEEQSKTVRLIFDLFLKGYGTSKIKYELERRGLLTSTGLKKWNSATITRVLQNPFYCGTIVYRKSYIPDYLEQKPKKNKGEVEQEKVEGKHKAIVTKEEFEQVQNMFKEKKIINKGTFKATDTWSKKLICSCGSTFNRRIYHRDGDKITYCYQCYNQKNNGSYDKRIKEGLSTDGACNNPIIPEWKLSIIANKLFSIIFDNDTLFIEEINKLIDLNINEDDLSDDRSEELIEVRHKIESIKNKLDKLLDLCLNDVISKDEYSKKRDNLDESLSKYNKELLSISNSKPESNNKIDELKRIINNNLIINSNVSDDIINGLIEKIVVDHNHFKVKLNTGLTNTSSNDLSFTINKDDVKEFVLNNSQYKKLRLKEDIIVDIIF